MVKRLYENLTDQEKLQIKLEQHGVCAICFCDFSSDLGGLVIDHDHDSGLVRKALCKGCNTAIGLLQEDWDQILRAACYVIVHKAGMDDLRIGYKLLFEEAQKQEARQMANIKQTAKEYLCQAKQELLQEVASVGETIPTVKPAVPETFISKDSEVSK